MLLSVKVVVDFGLGGKTLDAASEAIMGHLPDLMKRIRQAEDCPRNKRAAAFRTPSESHPGRCARGFCNPSDARFR
eukprot:15447161-Alexandrium_andersonii.AAC.1